MSWVPVPNKPTVSVDIKQHSTNRLGGGGGEASWFVLFLCVRVRFVVVVVVVVLGGVRE